MESLLNNELITQLAESLGVATEFIWDALNRQVYVNGTMWLIAFILFIIIFIVMYKPIIKISSMDVPYLFFLVFPVVIIFGTLYETLTHWFNPNYVALQLIKSILPF